MAFNFIKVTLLVACFATASSVRTEAHEVTSDGYNSSFANGGSAIFAQAPEELRLTFDQVPADEKLGFTLSEDNKVTEVVAGSAADNADLKQGDKIIGLESVTQGIIRDNNPLFSYRLRVLGAVGGVVWVERGTGAEVGAVATDLAAAGKPYEAESPPEQEPGQDLGYEVDADNTVIMVRGGSQAWKQGARAGDLATKTGFQKAGQPMFSGVQLPVEDLKLLGLSSEELGPTQESKKIVSKACKMTKFKFHPDKQGGKSPKEIEEAGQMFRKVNNACEKLEGLLVTAGRLSTEALPATEFEVLVEGPMGVVLEDIEELEQGKVEKTFVKEVAPDSRAEQLGIKLGDAVTAFASVASGRNYFRFFREGGFANSAH